MTQPLISTADVRVSKSPAGFFLRFAYNADAVRAVKAVRGARWNRDAYCWTLPLMDRGALQAIVQKLDACFIAERDAILADACVGQDYSPDDLLREAAKDEARERAEQDAEIEAAGGITAWIAKCSAKWDAEWASLTGRK